MCLVTIDFQTLENQPTKGGGAMRVLCYGDSDTYGHNPCSPLGEPYPPSVRWTDRLSAATGCPVLNAGLNGREIPHRPDTLADAEALFASAAPLDLATVFLGSNDLFQGCTARETADRMARFLDRMAGFPLVLLEAMQHALPIIATPVGAIPDMVEDGVTGLIIPEQDAKALAEAMQGFIEHPERIRSMGEAARGRFLQSYTVNRFEQHLLHILAH